MISGYWHIQFLRKTTLKFIQFIVLLNNFAPLEARRVCCRGLVGDTPQPRPTLPKRVETAIQSPCTADWGPCRSVVGTVQGVCRWRPKNDENTYRSSEPTIHCDWGIPNLYLDQPITKEWLAPAYLLDVMHYNPLRLRHSQLIFRSANHKKDDWCQPIYWTSHIIPM